MKYLNSQWETSPRPLEKKRSTTKLCFIVTATRLSRSDLVFVRSQNKPRLHHIEIYLVAISWICIVWTHLPKKQGWLMHCFCFFWGVFFWEKVQHCGFETMLANPCIKADRRDSVQCFAKLVAKWGQACFHLFLRTGQESRAPFCGHVWSSK